MNKDIYPFKVQKVGDGLAVQGINPPKGIGADDVLYTIHRYGKPDSVCTPRIIRIPSQLEYNGEILDVIEISDYPFEGCEHMEELYIPETVKKIRWNGRGRLKLKKISVNSDNPVFQDIDGVLYTRRGYNREGERKHNWMELIAYPTLKDDEYIVEAGTTKIGNQAFKYTNIKKVSLPTNLIEIGDSAFYRCERLIEIQLPDNINSINGSAFFGCTKLKHINIPLSLSVICHNVFGNCSSLSDIDIHDHITKIEDFAFIKCISLNNINIPCNVNHIGKRAFEKCTCLTSITIPNSITKIEDGLFCGDSSLQSVTIGDSVTIIGEAAFQNCTSLSSVVIPNTVTVIGGSAFEGCIKLDEVFIGNSVSNIGRSAFDRTGVFNNSLNGVFYVDKWACGYKNISSNTEISLADGTCGIADWAFWDCSVMTSMIIPKSVRTIGKYAFCNCSSLTNIHIPNGVDCIGENAFSGCSSLQSISIPNSIRRIPSELFGRCSSLQSIDIPESVESIGPSAFYKCTSLKEIDIPKSVSIIDLGAFINCTSLISIDLPNSIAKIKERVFWGCSSIKRIDIPNSVVEIGGGCFWECTSLKSIVIPNSITKIDLHVFDKCESLRIIYLPKDLEIIEDVFQKAGVESFSVAEGNSLFSSIDGVLFRCWNFKPYEIRRYPPMKTQSKYIVSEDVMYIAPSAFCGAIYLEEIILHDDICELESHSNFEECISLKEIRIPSKIDRIPNACFKGCKSLERVYISAKEGLYIGFYSFEGCLSLKELHLSVVNAENIFVRDEAFDEETFDKCILFIPAGTRWAYRHHPLLGKFKNIEIDNIN